MDPKLAHSLVIPWARELIEFYLFTYHHEDGCSFKLLRMMQQEYRKVLFSYQVIHT